MLQFPGEDNVNLAEYQLALAKSLAKTGQVRQAIALARRSHDALSIAFGESSRRLVEPQLLLARLHGELHEWKPAFEAIVAAEERFDRDQADPALADEIAKLRGQIARAP